MGVPTFFKWLCVKYPKVLKDAIEAQATEIDGQTIPADSTTSTENPNGEFDNLYLDMNGIIHPCCHPEDSDCPASEEDMFNAIFEYIDRLMAVVQPRKLLYMAIDGVAPRAKMNQQRMRRFKTAADVDQEETMYEELKEQFESEGREVPPPKSHWDSNVITPGTPFFDRLTKGLRYYINHRMSNDPSWRGLKVILSDASCPGEGEHKIMHYIRAQRTYPEYDPNQRHCLYGADADLIMLGLATHEPHFTIMREAVLDAVELRKCYLCGRTGHIASECMGEPAKEPEAPAALQTQKSSWKPLQFLKIAVLREYLEHEFAFNDAPDFQPDFERCIDDFVLMCFFVGNDFLPHLPSLSIHKGSIDQMMLLYQKILPSMPNYLTDAGKLNLSCLKTFVDHLGKVEGIIFQEELKRQNRMKTKRAEDEARVKVRVAEREAAAALVGGEDDNFAALRQLKEDVKVEVKVKVKEEVKEEVVMEGEVSEETSEVSTPSLSDTTSTTEETQPPPAKRQKVSHEGNIDEFKAKMRAKHKEATEIENPEDSVQLGIGGKKDWRIRYYKQKFHLTDEDLENIDPFASRVATAYAEGLSWVLHYYYQGVCSWEWYYPFHYAPFASDIADFGLEESKPWILGQPFKPFEQLMAVLPARSSHCIPPALARLMEDPRSPIIDFYPKKFKEDPDGKRFKWQWVVLLPFIEQQRLLDTVRPLESELTLEERQRNSTGTERLFVSQFHPLAPHIALVQTAKDDSERKQKLKSELSDSLCGELQNSKHGFVTGSIIDAGEHASEGYFPPLPATCLSCEFLCVVAHPHLCRFLPGATPPESVLTPMDLQEDCSRDRRFNAGAAKRIIMGSLGRQGLVDKQIVDQYFRHPRDNNTNFGPNIYHTAGVHSDNRYQGEMFGTGRQKRSRPEEWNGHADSSFPPAHRQRSDPDYRSFRQGGYQNRSSSYDRQSYNRQQNNQYERQPYHRSRDDSQNYRQEGRRYNGDDRKDFHSSSSNRGGVNPYHNQGPPQGYGGQFESRPHQQHSSQHCPPPPPPSAPSIWTSDQFSLQHHPGRANASPPPNIPSSQRTSQPPWLRQQQQQEDPYKR